MGKTIYFYENGHQECEINFIEGKKQGKLILYYENGQKRAEYIFCK